MKITVLTSVLLLALPGLTETGSLAHLLTSRQVGQKCVLRFRFKNTLPKKIVSARAQVCLVDAHGKIQARTTRWMIGAAKGQPPLSPDESTVYHVVLEPADPYCTVRLSFSRVVMEGGETATVPAGVWPASPTQPIDPQGPGDGGCGKTKSGF